MLMLHSISTRWTLLSLAMLLLVAGLTEAQQPASRLFKPEGHGKAGVYYFPDDEVRRIRALDDVVTPHLEWAVPLAGGPIRVLAIAHKAQGRWPIELKQRLDMELTTVYGHDRGMLGTNNAGYARGLFVQGQADVQSRILQAMNQPIDVIVNDILVEALGDEVRRRLSSLIRHGVGYVGPTEGLDLEGFEVDSEGQVAMIAATAPFADLRAWVNTFDSPQAAAGVAVKLWANAQGSRLANLDGYPRDDQKPDANRLQYLDQIDMEWEAWSAMTGRVLLWAAHRLDAAGSVKVTWPSEKISRDALPQSLPVESAENMDMSVCIWDADGRLRYQGAEATIPVLLAQQYFVRVTHLQDGAVADWAFGTIDICSSVEIAEITLDSEYKRVGDLVTATIALSQRPPNDWTVVVEGLDNHGRVVARSNHPPAEQLTTQVDMAQSLHIYNFVNVKLIDAQGALVDEDRHAFYIDQPNPGRDDLSWFVWEGGDGFHPRTRNLLKQYARLGPAGFLNGCESVAMANAHAVHWVYRMKGVTVDDKGMTYPTLTSPGYVSQEISQIQEKARKYEPQSPLFYYLGDDVKYTSYGQDGGWSPSGRAALSQWAQQQYESLESLNQAWGTSYASWDDIEPIKQSDALAAVEAGRFGELCHWVDAQLYEDQMFAGLFDNLAEGIHEVAPDTPAGMGCSVVGWTWPGSGMDYWQLAKDKDLVFQYPNPWIHDIFRSAAAPDAYHGVWYGGYGLYNYYPYDDQEYLPWWSVFRGANLHGQYYGGQSSTWFSERLLGADLGPIDGFAKILKNLDELKGGIAKLLFNAERRTDGIAMVYAPSNIHSSVVFAGGLPQAPEWAGQYTDSPNFTYMQCWEGLSYLISDAGFPYDVIHESTLADAEDLSRDYRVIVLPFSVRLSQPHADALAQFVRTGGILITDIFPGILDGQCRADHQGVLADVLGVSFPGGLPTDRTKMHIAADPAGRPLGPWAVDTGVTLNGAQALAQTAEGAPILLVHKYGQGTTVLLNVMARDYQVARTYGSELNFRDSMTRFLAEQASLKPSVDCQVASRDEKQTHRIQATEFNSYRLDDAEYVGVLRHHKLRADDVARMADLRPKPCWITFDHKSHVYDIRHRMYRGFTDKIEDVIYPARAELYALMPYEIRGLTLSANRTGPAVRVQGAIVADDDGPSPSSHIFHMEISDPSGQIRREYTANIMGKAGRFATDVFLGYNAQPGLWHVNVRDVVSGIDRSVAVEF